MVVKLRDFSIICTNFYVLKDQLFLSGHQCLYWHLQDNSDEVSGLIKVCEEELTCG